jgi:hypothetical protein
VQAALSYQFCPGNSVLAVFFCLSCYACPVLPALLCLSCSTCPVLPVLF